MGEKLGGRLGWEENDDDGERLGQEEKDDEWITYLPSFGFKIKKSGKGQI